MGGCPKHSGNFSSKVSKPRLNFNCSTHGFELNSALNERGQRCGRCRTQGASLPNYMQRGIAHSF